MKSSSREQVGAVLDRLDAAVDELLELSFEELTTPERFAVLGRLEAVARRLPVPGHGLINDIARQASPAEIGGRLAAVLAERLHISRADANRRIGEAAELGARRSLTGEVLPPLLEGT